MTILCYPMRCVHILPHSEIASGNSLLYHITWPQKCTVSVIAESRGSRLSSGERYREYDHEEADMTMVSYALEKLSNGAKYLPCN